MLHDYAQGKYCMDKVRASYILTVFAGEENISMAKLRERLT